MQLNDMLATRAMVFLRSVLVAGKDRDYAVRAGPAGGFSSCCIVPWISASYGTDERQIKFHTHPRSSGTYLCFLLVEFTSDLLDVRFDSLSKGCHLALAYAPAK